MGICISSKYLFRLANFSIENSTSNPEDHNDNKIEYSDSVCHSNSECNVFLLPQMHNNVNRKLTIVCYYFN